MDYIGKKNKSRDRQCWSGQMLISYVKGSLSATAVGPATIQRLASQILKRYGLVDHLRTRSSSKGLRIVLLKKGKEITGNI
jgi:hypothetical protein